MAPVNTWSNEANATKECTSGSFFATSMNSLRACLKSFACTAHALALYLPSQISTKFQLSTQKKCVLQSHVEQLVVRGAKVVGHSDDPSDGLQQPRAVGRDRHVLQPLRCFAQPAAHSDDIVYGAQGAADGTRVRDQGEGRCRLLSQTC